MKRLPTILTSAGVTIFLAFWISAVVFGNSPYDTAEREGWWSAFKAAAGLELLWVTVAAPLAITRWRATAWKFRAVLGLNAAVACLLVAELITDLLRRY